MHVFEFEVHTSTNDDLKVGALALMVSKILVADVDWWSAYKTAVAMAWRGDRMVTGCWWVP